MNWKEQLDKALGSIKEATESDKAKEIATTAKSTAIGTVNQASGNTFDLGPEDGANVVVTKF
ncbi:MAG: hypothetical protein C1943_16285 [Halochromatium sp.]|nr:hypothetical protein [Halochromatium sp.]